MPIVDDAVDAWSPAASADSPGSPPRFDWKPALAKHGAEPLFGSFIKPSPVPALPSDDACPADMVGVEGDYCPLIAQKCVRWLDAEKLQCAEFERMPAASCPIQG